MMNLDQNKADYDIIVVGGGPAGCAFVRSLIGLRSGLRVLLVEKERFPRDKVCGDGLTYQAIPVVREVFPELASLTPSSAFTSRQVLCYPPGQRLMREGQILDVIPRLEFDNALWQATVEAGAETLENAAVIGLLTGENGVRGVKLREANGSRELTCRLLVGADGSRSVVRRETGSTDDDHVIHALRQYVRGIPDSTEGLIFSFDLEYWGYFWIFPFVRNGERWANVGYGNVTDNRILKERLAHYCQTPEMQRYLGTGRFEGKPTGFPLNLARFKWNGRLSRRLCGPGFLLLGDAGSLIQPLSGEGIAFAIESGRIAAEVLVDDGIPQKRKGAIYEKRVLRRVRPSFLSVTAFCAIRLPMLLPRPLSHALVCSVGFVQERLGLGVRPLRLRLFRNEERDRLERINSRSDARRKIISLESVTLLVLLTALAAFWLARFLHLMTLPPAYSVRANLFAGIASVFCLLDARRRYGWPFAFIFLGFALASSVGVEVLGTRTGAIFGPYHYSSKMPGQLFGTLPIVVPFVWFIISYLAFATAAILLPKRAPLWPRAAAATALFVGYDLAADPNHVFRGGWTFPDGGAYYGIPLQNFAAWGALGLVSFLILGLIERREHPPLHGNSVMPLALIAYAGLMLHEGLFALLIAGHRGAGAIACAVTATVVTRWFCAISPRRSPSPLL